MEACDVSSSAGNAKAAAKSEEFGVSLHVSMQMYTGEDAC
jgi:hypothetical protein